MSHSPVRERIPEQLKSAFSISSAAIILVIDFVAKLYEHVILSHIVETIGVEKTEVGKQILDNPWTLVVVSIALYCVLLVAKALFSLLPVILPKKIAPVSLPSIQQQANYAKLTYCGYRNTNLYIGQWDFEGVIEPRNQKHFANSFKGLVLKFENEPWTNGIDTST